MYQWQNAVTPTIGYSFPCVIKLDRFGDTLWTKDYEFDTTGYYQGTSFTRTLDGNLLLGGSVSLDANPGKFNYFLIKVDTAGNLLWQKTYGAPTVDERLSSVSEFADGRILLSGVTRSGSLSYPWVIITDSLGAVQWQKVYNQQALSWGGGYSRPAKTGGFILMGMSDIVIDPGDDPNCGYLARMDSQGNFTWLKFFNSKWFTQIWDFYELSNGDIVFCGDRKDSVSNWQYAYIAKVDSNSNLLWWQTYHETSIDDNYLSCVRPAPDGGFVACGSTFASSANGGQNAWIIKTDSLGCALINCTLGTDDVTKGGEKFQLFPNPAANVVTISLTNDQFMKDDILSVYDLAGKLIQRIIPVQGHRSETVNTSEWNNGVYVFVLQGRDNKIINKLTIQR